VEGRGLLAAGIDPWRPTGKVTDEEARGIVRGIRPLMQQSARDGTQDRFKVIYARRDRTCPRCGGRILQKGQWDDNRPTYWCEGCQR
jgi:endonuclease-8